MIIIFFLYLLLINDDHDDQRIRGSANSTSLYVDIYIGFLHYKKPINEFEGRGQRGRRG